MKIPQHICDLLYERGSVIVPGFGEFRTTDQPASRTVDKKITPPSKSISYNPLIKANDYVLAKYISEKENTTITAGNEMLKKYVEELNEKLETEKSVTIHGLGTVKLDDSNFRSFVPEEDTNFDTSSYGLTPADTTEKSMSESDDKHDDDDEPPVKRERKRRTSLVWLLVILILLGGGVVWGYFNQDMVSEYYTKIRVAIGADKDIEEITEEKDEAAIEADPELADIPDPEPKFPEEIPPSEPDEPIEIDDPAITERVPAQPIHTTKGKYHIIAGCFKDKNNAENLIITLKDQGFVNASMAGQTAGGLYRVSAGAFNTEREAVQIINREQANNKLENAWVIKL